MFNSFIERYFNDLGLDKDKLMFFYNCELDRALWKEQGDALINSAVRDLSGKNNHFTLADGVEANLYDSSPGAIFDGTLTLNLTNNNNNNPKKNSFTWGAAISANIALPSNSMFIMGNHNGANDSGIMLHIGATGYGRVKVQDNDSHGDSLGGSVDITDGNIYYITGLLDYQAKKTKCFINGLEVDTKTATMNNSEIDFIHDWCIGNLKYGLSGTYPLFTGRLYEFYLTTQVLRSAEIMFLYQRSIIQNF